MSDKIFVTLLAMKKVVVGIISLLVLGFFLFFLFKSQKNIEVVQSFNDPLFVSKEDLISLGFIQYHYIENKGEPGKSYFSVVLPKKDSRSPTNSVMIDIYQRVDAKEYFEKLEKISRMPTKEANYVDNYNNLGERNVLFTIYDKDEYMASLRVLYKDYIIQTQVDSLENLDQAIKQADLFTKLILEKIKKLQL